MGRQTKSFRQTRSARVADKSAKSFGTYQRMEPYGKKVTGNK